MKKCLAMLLILSACLGASADGPRALEPTLPVPIPNPAPVPASNSFEWVGGTCTLVCDEFDTYYYQFDVVAWYSVSGDVDSLLIRGWWSDTGDFPEMSNLGGFPASGAGGTGGFVFGQCKVKCNSPLGRDLENGGTLYFKGNGTPRLNAVSGTPTPTDWMTMTINGVCGGF